MNRNKKNLKLSTEECCSPLDYPIFSWKTNYFSFNVTLIHSFENLKAIESKENRKSEEEFEIIKSWEEKEFE